MTDSRKLWLLRLACCAVFLMVSAITFHTYRRSLPPGYHMMIKKLHKDREDLYDSLNELKEQIRNSPEGTLSEAEQSYLNEFVAATEAKLKEREAEMPGWPFWECMKMIVKEKWKPLLIIHLITLLPLIACYGVLKDKLVNPASRCG